MVADPLLILCLACGGWCTVDTEVVQPVYTEMHFLIAVAISFFDSPIDRETSARARFLDRIKNACDVKECVSVTVYAREQICAFILQIYCIEDSKRIYKSRATCVWPPRGTHYQVIRTKAFHVKKEFEHGSSDERSDRGFCWRAQ